MALITTSFVVVFSLQWRAGRARPLFFIFSFLFFWGIIGGEIIKGFKGKKKRGGRKGRFSSLFFARNSPQSAASFRELRLAVVLRSNSIRPSQSIAALIRRYALSNYFLLPAPTPWPYIADFTRPKGHTHLACPALHEPNMVRSRTFSSGFSFWRRR